MAEMSHPSTSSELEEGLTQASMSPSEPSEGRGSPVYEIGYHLVPAISEADLAAPVGRLHTVLEKAGAAILAEGEPKKMQFAYRLERSVSGKREKYTEGYFGWIKFEAEASAINAVEAAIHSDRDILRSLLIHTTRESATPAPRAVFSSDRLEGETIAKPVAAKEEKVEISEEELEKSLEAIVGE